MMQRNLKEFLKKRRTLLKTLETNPRNASGNLEEYPPEETKTRKISLAVGY